MEAEFGGKEGGDISVLVVDDEPDVRDVIARFVERLGLAVTECQSGEAALAELGRSGHDIIISDIRMRGMDGVELLRRVKEKWPGTEFILVSGNASLEAAIEALRSGAYDILLKPVRKEQLQSSVSRCRERILHARENRELRAVVERLSELNSRKEKFIAVANHELRTPTTVAAGVVSMLKRRAAAMTPEVAELVTRADEAMGRLKEVVREIGELATARSFEQWVRPCPCTLGPLVRDVEKSLTDQAGLRNLVTVFENRSEADLPLMADHAKVARAVGALIQNAVKYTPDGREVLVTVEREGELVLFTVADRGVGIPKGEEERIFDIFYTVGSELAHHTSDHEFMGSGLGVGLSLAQLVAQAHGGDVGYSPNPGGGSIFTLSILAKPGFRT